MRDAEISPVSLHSSTTRRHLLYFPHSLCTDMGSCLSLVHWASPAISRPSVRALFFYHLISLGHWFSFAIPSLSLGGASVVAEENRYPFYVFIISQIKKLMN